MAALRVDSRVRRGGEVAAILLLALAAYAPTLSSSFHLDDYSLLADPAVTSADGWWRVFRLAQTRPLAYLTFWLNYRLGGAEPWGYHAVNVALHLAAAWALWSAFRRVLSPWAALAGTAVFALHPLQSEAVAYVFARATVLAALLSIVAWRAWLDGRRWRAVAWFVLAVLAKEEAVAFPVFLAAVEWAQGRWQRRNWAPLAAMLAASLAAGMRLLYVVAHAKGTGVARSAGVAPGTYLLTQPKVIWSYLRLFIVPVGLNFDHDVRTFLARDWWAPAVLLALVALAIWRFRAGGVWVAGALVLLAPTSSVVPLADLMFEHRMYLPMVGLAAGAGILLAKIPRPAVVALTVAMTAATWARARVWSSEETLWSDAAAKSPGKVRPKLQLARAVAAKDPARAEALLLEAQKLEPENGETYTQLGTLMLDRGNPARALEEFDEALRRHPDSADAHGNRGVALYLLGRIDEAEREFQRALELDPCHPNALHNLALLYGSRGDTARRQEMEVQAANCRGAQR